MVQKGKFITFEGGDGAGKSTQITSAQQYLEEQGKKVWVTREPGGTVLGERLREILLSNDATMQLHPDTELMLMFASRAQHLQEKIIPQLNCGTWVLCDRFTDATFAYQGGGRGIASDRIAALEQWVQGDIQPDLTLLFDLDVTQGLSRASKRAELDRFESEDIAFFERIRAAYLARAKADASRFNIIDASRSMNQVSQDVQHVLAALLEAEAA